MVQGRREERESWVRRSKVHVTCLLVARLGGVEEGLLSLLTCSRNMFLVGEEGRVMFRGLTTFR